MKSQNDLKSLDGGDRKSSSAWLFSRKLLIQSVSRHFFSGYKPRHFTLLSTEEISSEVDSRSNVLGSFGVSSAFDKYLKAHVPLLIVRSASKKNFTGALADSNSYPNNVVAARVSNAALFNTLEELDQKVKADELYLSCVVVLSPSFNVSVNYHHYFNGTTQSSNDVADSKIVCKRRDREYCLSIRYTDPEKYEDTELLLVFNSRESAGRWKQASSCVKTVVINACYITANPESGSMY